jgi:RNA-directed DNA polymerase
VVEIDLRKCFNSIPHGQLMDCLGKKIKDKRFLELIYRLLKAPILEGGRELPSELGCPQGSVVSPTLANIYLHDVVDVWFDGIKQSHVEGKAELIRYADDMVFVFQKKRDAERFYEVLPKRLNKYGLTLHEEKSQLIESGHTACERAHRRKERMPTYYFLGFTCYWGKSKRGYWRLKYTSRRDRFTTKLKGLKEYLRKQLTTRDTQSVLEHVVRVVKGWINYHGISDNQRRVKSFIEESQRILFNWNNRRGRKNPMNWKKFSRILEEIDFPRSWRTVSMFTS